MNQICLGLALPYFYHVSLSFSKNVGSGSDKNNYQWLLDTMPSVLQFIDIKAKEITAKYYLVSSLLRFLVYVISKLTP